MIGGFPSTQTRLLYFIVACGYGARKGLLSLAGSPMALSRGIEFLIAGGYVSEHTVTETTKGGWRAKDIYYRPTRLGIEYLASQVNKMPADARWVRDLPDRMSQHQIVKGSLLFGQERVQRYLGISSAAMFAAAAGCNVQTIVPVEFSNEQRNRDADGGGQRNCEAGNGELAKRALCEAEGSESAQQGACEAGSYEVAKQRSGTAKDKTTIHLIVRDLLRESADLEQNSNGTIMNTDSDVFFIDAYRIKESLREKRISPALLRVGRYAGIVESPLKTVFLYAGRRQGMGWSKPSVDTDVRACQAYVNLVSRYHSNRSGEKHGAMLVANAKMFEDLYKDKEGKRRKGEGFANGFHDMAIFPMTEEGVYSFVKYMAVDTREYQEDLVESAIASGLYRRNPSASNLFPLVNSGGVRMAIGLFIDAIQIRNLIAAYETDKKPMGIVCYEWQQDYYRRVVPDGTLLMAVV